MYVASTWGCIGLYWGYIGVNYIRVILGSYWDYIGDIYILGLYWGCIGDQDALLILLSVCLICLRLGRAEATGSDS